MPHWAVGLWLLARARPEHDPAEFIASEAGHKSYIAGIVRREGTSVHRGGNAPATAELHGAYIHSIHLRRDDSSVALFDENTGYVAPTEVASQR
jgi:hypothetical protein